MTNGSMYAKLVYMLYASLLMSHAFGQTLDYQRRMLTDSTTMTTQEASTPDASSGEAEMFDGFKVFRDTVSLELGVSLEQIGDVAWSVSSDVPDTLRMDFVLTPDSEDTFTDNQVTAIKKALNGGELGTFVDMSPDEDNPSAYDVTLSSTDDVEEIKSTFATLRDTWGTGLGYSADRIGDVILTISPTELQSDFDILPESGKQKISDEDVNTIKSSLAEVYGAAFGGLEADDDGAPGALDATITDTYDAGNNSSTYYTKYGNGVNTLMSVVV